MITQRFTFSLLGGWCLWRAIPGSRAPPATPHRAPCYSSCSAGEERRPGTGSEMASGSDGPGCPHTESPGSGSPHCSFWNTAWRRRERGYLSPWCQVFNTPNPKGFLRENREVPAFLKELSLAQVNCLPHSPYRGSHSSSSPKWGLPMFENTGVAAWELGGKSSSVTHLLCALGQVTEIRETFWGSGVEMMNWDDNCHLTGLSGDHRHWGWLPVVQCVSQWAAIPSGVCIHPGWRGTPGQATPFPLSESCQKPVFSMTLKARWVMLCQVKDLHEGNNWNNCSVVWLQELSKPRACPDHPSSSCSQHHVPSSLRACSAQAPWKPLRGPPHCLLPTCPPLRSSPCLLLGLTSLAGCWLLKILINTDALASPKPGLTQPILK